MSREKAHEILDDAKSGKPIPADWIDEALRATGDLDHRWLEHTQETTQ